MKTQDEIQKAHDTIVAALFGQCGPIDWTDEVKQCFHAAADVLCWVLDHDHNVMFNANMFALEERIRANGGKMEKPDAKQN